MWGLQQLWVEGKKLGWTRPLLGGTASAPEAEARGHPGSVWLGEPGAGKFRTCWLNALFHARAGVFPGSSLKSECWTLFDKIIVVENLKNTAESYLNNL